MPKAYVLLSGGIDSSTCLAIANRDWNGNVMAVSVQYGQKHSNEVQHAANVARYSQNQFTVRDISSFVSKGGLTDPALDVPKVAYSELKGVSPTYVPFRNGTLLALIAGIASIDPEAEAVYFGAHSEDAENWAYPDCTPEFIGGMANAIYIGTYHKVRLFTPLQFMTKAEVVEQGNKLGVPWNLTWSCYEGGEEQCGICSTCRARRGAFDIAGVYDPTFYASNEGPTS